jgi:hypothetical protein
MEEINQATLTDEPQQSAPSMDDTIADAWKDITSRGEVTRDESGKFAATQTEETPTETPATEELPAEEAAPEESAPEQPAIKAPSSWKKEAQAKFAALDPEIQAEVLRRENDMHNGIAQYKQHAERAQAYDRAFSPFMETINKFGVTPDVAAAELFKADHALRYGSPAQKVAMVQQIFRDYQINPEWLTQAGQPQVNPEVGYLQNRLQEMESRQSQFQQQQQAALESQQNEMLNSTISEFAKTHEHFEAVRNVMAALMTTDGKTPPVASTMQDAYDMAIHANPELRAAIIAKQQAEARAAAQAKAESAKKTAAVNVRTKGVIPAQKAVGSIEDTIRATAKELGMI